MSYGIVIGTYDSEVAPDVRHGVRSVELNLAVIRARCGDVPVLVCDDASPPASQLAYRAVCARYGAEYLSGAERLGHTSGDIAAFGHGLAWARRLGLQTLTKLSHRMIFDVPNWIHEDSRRLLRSGFGTMTAALANFGEFSKIRTEAVMMVVDRWYRDDILEQYQPRHYGFWNEGHTATVVSQLVDPLREFPHYLPWERMRPVRGWDAPPVYFRSMQSADENFRALAGRYGIAWPAALRQIDSICTRDYRP